MSREQRIKILGVPVDCLSWPGALQQVEELLASAGPPASVIAVNPEKIMRAKRDPELLQALRGAQLLIPDGIGVVLAARILRLGRMERVPGSELMPRICEIAARTGRGVYLFGASDAVNRQAAAELARRYPGVRIAGRHHGYAGAADMGRIVESINSSGADILFLALGSPRQEQWMARHLPCTRVRLCQGVGGTFDVLAGTVRRAPAAFIKLNLEWLYRLLSQPQRLLRQTALPRFASQVLGEFLSGLSAGRAAQPPGTGE